MESILQVRDLRTSFLTSNGEVKAVRGVSFDVEKGKTLGMIFQMRMGNAVFALVFELIGKIKHAQNVGFGHIGHFQKMLHVSISSLRSVNAYFLFENEIPKKIC